MKAKKIKVFIKLGYHVDSTESGKYHEYWIDTFSGKDPYAYALFKLKDTDEENPGGYMVAIPAMMDSIVYEKAWDIIDTPVSLTHIVRLYLSLFVRTVAWKFITVFMKMRVEREKLMRLSGLMDRKDTLYHKWSPEEAKIKLYTLKKERKSSDLYDEMFFN